MSPFVDLPTLGVDPDSTVIARVRDGDRNATHRLLELCAADVHRYVAARLDDAILAEEVSTDVLLRMIESLRRPRKDPRSFSAQLYRVANRRVELELELRQRCGDAQGALAGETATGAVSRAVVTPPISAARLLAWCLPETN